MTDPEVEDGLKEAVRTAITTTETMENEMPRTLSGATQLRSVIADDQNDAEAREVQIHTKAQQRLLADTERADELDAEINKERDYLMRMRNNRAELDRLIAQSESNIKDAEAERQSCLTSAHSLRTAGVTL